MVGAAHCGRDGEHRSESTTEDAFCCRTKQPFANAAEPVRAHDDQVGALPRGGSEDHVSRVSHSYIEAHIGGIWDSVRPCFGGELAKSRLGLGVNEITTEPQFGRFSQEGFDRVDNRQPAPSSSSEHLRPSKGVARLLGEINRAEQRAKGGHIVHRVTELLAAGVPNTTDT